MDQRHPTLRGLLSEIFPRTSVCGIPFDNLDRETALKKIAKYASSVNGNGSRKVYFSNVHTIITARRDQDLRECISSADLVLPDGSGLKIAGRVLGTSVVENLNGTDLTPQVLDLAVKNNWTVYLLGATPEVLNKCLAGLLQSRPDLRIVGSHHGFFSPTESKEIVDAINVQKPNLLLVAMGTPIQEKWIAAHADYLKVGACLAVGGLFDFLSGSKKRAPRWARKAGVEWLFRFIRDPKTKWNRIFVEIPVFLTLVLRERLFPHKVRDASAEKIYVS
jgi:N-acetylglucosaminyldiphosphoundecaprenol N-acetyl-beta-D-mannosaminyltransferase